MYKKTEKKITFLLDKLLLHVTSGNDPYGLRADYVEGQIYDILKANKELLPVDIQEKIIQILPVTHSWVLLSAFQSKNYQHLSCEVVKLLDLKDPHFSDHVIETLYKMGTYQYVDEVRPFAVVSVDDKMPFSQVTYREGMDFSYLRPGDNPSFKFLNDTANKYIKRAGKLKEKNERKGFL